MPLPTSIPAGNTGMPSGHVDGARLWQRLGELAAIGATPAGGVERPALSPDELAARAAIVAWGARIGLVAANDPAGNLFLRLEGSRPEAEPVLTGSYLDSQPRGGKFSGSYGMLAALEALEAIVASGSPPRRPIMAVAWMNGEGSRFTPGYLGSQAFAGQLQLASLRAVRDSSGVSVGEALDQVFAAATGKATLPLGFACAAYVEAHLEQGTSLEQKQCQIGVVSAMQGIRRYQVRVLGEAAHVGTTPRARRRDALNTAIRIIGALNEFYAAPDIGFAVGQMLVEPNVPSIVPREVVFAIDIRHRDNTVLTRLGDTIRLICESEKGPCGFEMTEIAHEPALTFDAAVPTRIREVAEQLNLSHTSMLSLAGHDARNLNAVCPTGLIFIPCRGGISHNEAEAIEPDDAAAGARVLTDVLWQLANAG